MSSLLSSWPLSQIAHDTKELPSLSRQDKDENRKYSLLEPMTPTYHDVHWSQSFDMTFVDSLIASSEFDDTCIEADRTTCSCVGTQLVLEDDDNKNTNDETDTCIKYFNTDDIDIDALSDLPTCSGITDKVDNNNNNNNNENENENENDHERRKTHHPSLTLTDTTSSSSSSSYTIDFVND